MIEEKEIEIKPVQNEIVGFNDLSRLLPDPDKVAQRADLTKKMLNH